jgi:hypothetical protein
MATQAPGIKDMKEEGRASRAGLFPRAGALSRVAWVVVFVVTWLSASRAWGNSAPLPVGFDGKARELPQAAIRVAIATELGREVLAESQLGGDGEGVSENRERVVVAVDELGQLWVRYWGPGGLVDRHLPMPKSEAEVPLVVSLAVGNLVRGEAFELLRDLERQRALERRRTAERRARELRELRAEERRERAREAARREALVRIDERRRMLLRVRRLRSRPQLHEPLRNAWLGQVIWDLARFAEPSPTCQRRGVACYGLHYEPVSDADVRQPPGLVHAHTRLAFGYGRRLRPNVWTSALVGIATSGGAAKDAAAQSNESRSAFMPLLFALRAQYFPGQGAMDGKLRPYVHAVGGVSEQTTESVGFHEPSELEPLAFRAHVVHSMGLLFAGGGAGLSLRVERLRLELEAGWVAAFPLAGWLIRPGLGAAYDF